MTFLDARRGNDTSARVGNALMAAADPATSAATYQTFVNELYRNGGTPNLEEIATTARDSGLPAHVVDRIAAGEFAVDPTSMNAFNRVQLLAANPESPGTPRFTTLAPERSSKPMMSAGWTGYRARRRSTTANPPARRCRPARRSPRSNRPG